jgi:hypothetical protein
MKRAPEQPALPACRLRACALQVQHLHRQVCGETRHGCHSVQGMPHNSRTCGSGSIAALRPPGPSPKEPQLAHILLQCCEVHGREQSKRVQSHTHVYYQCMAMGGRLQYDPWDTAPRRLPAPSFPTAQARPCEARVSAAAQPPGCAATYCASTGCGGGSCSQRHIQRTRD